MPEQSREIELEERVELLQQQLDALTGSSQEIGVLVSLRHGMTERLATMLYILVKRAPAIISKSTFHSLIYGDCADGGPDPKIFALHISRLREVLLRAKAPGRIDTVWNAGYRANPELVKWVKALYDERIDK